MTIRFPLDTLAEARPSSPRPAAPSHRAQYKTTEDTDITQTSHSLSRLSSSRSCPSCSSRQIVPSPLSVLCVLCGSSSICVHPRSSAVSLSASAIRNRQSPTWAFFTASQFRPSLSPSSHYVQNPPLKKARKGPLFPLPYFLRSANPYYLLPLSPLGALRVVCGSFFFLPLPRSSAFICGFALPIGCIRQSFPPLRSLCSQRFLYPPASGAVLYFPVEKPGSGACVIAHCRKSSRSSSTSCQKIEAKNESSRF